MNIPKTALVTGATSGVGFETAAQLALRGCERVVVVGRSRPKALTALISLEARTGLKVFEAVAADNGRIETIRDAVASLDGPVHWLFFNAGLMSGKEIVRTSEDVEATFAATLIGHHAWLALLSEAGLVGPGLRVVVSGSEVALDTGKLSSVDVPAFASARSLPVETVMEAIARAQPPYVFDAGISYASVKRFVIWWARATEAQLGADARIDVVSPGVTLGTGAMRHSPLLPMLRLLGPVTRWLGKTMNVADSAERYLSIAASDHDAGRFWASAEGRWSGPLVERDISKVTSPALESACVKMTAKLAQGLRVETLERGSGRPQKATT